MRNHIGTFALLFFAGVGVGWCIFILLREPDQRAQAVATPSHGGPEVATANFKSGAEYSDLQSGGETLPDGERETVPATESRNRLAEASIVPSEVELTANSNPAMGQASERTDAAGRSHAPWERPSAQPEDLLQAASITCQFGPGLAGSARSVPTVRFDYQGSLIGFDTFDAEAGTARMSANIAGPTGAVKVRTDVTGSALHFSGLLPSGNFVLITVFGLTDEIGDYSAIMTMHNRAPVGLHTQINSGTCY